MSQNRKGSHDVQLESNEQFDRAFQHSPHHPEGGVRFRQSHFLTTNLNIPSFKSSTPPSTKKLVPGRHRAWLNGSSTYTHAHTHRDLLPDVSWIEVNHQAMIDVDRQGVWRITRINQSKSNYPIKDEHIWWWIHSIMWCNTNTNHRGVKRFTVITVIALVIVEFWNIVCGSGSRRRWKGLPRELNNLEHLLRKRKLGGSIPVGRNVGGVSTSLSVQYFY